MTPPNTVDPREMTEPDPIETLDQQREMTQSTDPIDNVVGGKPDPRGAPEMEHREVGSGDRIPNPDHNPSKDRDPVREPVRKDPMVLESPDQSDTENEDSEQAA